MYKYAIFTQTMREETISWHRPLPGLKSEVRGDDKDAPAHVPENYSLTLKRT